MVHSLGVRVLSGLISCMQLQMLWGGSSSRTEPTTVILLNDIVPNCPLNSVHSLALILEVYLENEFPIDQNAENKYLWGTHLHTGYRYHPIFKA